MPDSTGEPRSDGIDHPIPQEQHFTVVVLDEHGNYGIGLIERGYSPHGVIVQIGEKITSGQSHLLRHIPPDHIDWARHGVAEGVGRPPQSLTDILGNDAGRGRAGQ
jgi:hypothetical protein